MKLSFTPKWVRRPTVNGWYALRFSYSPVDEVIRVVTCINLGHNEDSFDLGFAINHEAMGCIHRNKDQKEFWFAGPISFKNAFKEEERLHSLDPNYVTDKQPSSGDSEAS